jgi:hypothetical protein
LRRLIATGSDLSKEMEVDFAMDVPDRETGLAFAAVAAPLGFRTGTACGRAQKNGCIYNLTLNILHDTIRVHSTRGTVASIGAVGNCLGAFFAVRLARRGGW